MNAPQFVSQALPLRRIGGVGVFLSVIMLLFSSATSWADPSIARVWDEQALFAIDNDFGRPPITSRNLLHMSLAMYDAWAAYDSTAAQFMHQEKVDTTGMSAGDIATAREEAISFAAFSLLKHRYVFGPAATGAPGAFPTLLSLEQQMDDLSYDKNFSSTAGPTPAALGNRIAQSIVDYGLTDGSNEVGAYDGTGIYTPTNPVMDFTQTGTNIVNPNHWQQLTFNNGQSDKFGNPLPNNEQEFMTPQWIGVTPFSMTDADKTGNIYHDQGAPPQLGDAAFSDAVKMLIGMSSKLDPTLPETIDASPGVIGNHVLGTYENLGRPMNPKTGSPYAPNEVKLGDWGRTIAEFWADPPSQWNLIANRAADEADLLGLDKRIGGTGPIVGDLEYDLKRYVTLFGSLYDAGIAAWTHKYYYDYVRPISMIRYMGSLGQSTDTGLSNYDPNGLPLESGLIEVITSATTAAGERHEHLAGHEGEIAIHTYQGPLEPESGEPPFDSTTDIGGVDWILAEDWMPFQLSSFVTPPFPGYVSGHSTFARAAAEALTAFTGDEYFPGGLMEFLRSEGDTFLAEYGPSEDVTLQWATYFDASDESGIARLWGGIHVPADDLNGRMIGHEVGLEAWDFVQQYFNGTVGVPEPSSGLLLAMGIAGLWGWRRRRVGNET